MFVKINDCCIVNTDNIVWIDVNDEKTTVKMTDGTEHAVASDKFQEAMNIINHVAMNASFER